MSSITGLISGGGGGGLSPTQYTLDTVPMFPHIGTNVESPLGYGSTSTNFWDAQPNDRDMSGNPSYSFYGTKGTGWTTVYNHTGSGKFFWFISTTFGNAAGTLAVKLTADGVERQFQLTQNISTINYNRICVGSFANMLDGSTSSERTIVDHQLDATYNINSDWGIPGKSIVCPFSLSGALTARYPYLQYETDFKIEVYNSHITTANRGNYYGGVVIQGY